MGALFIWSSQADSFSTIASHKQRMEIGEMLHCVSDEGRA